MIFVNPVHNDQLTALREYFNAAEEVRNHGGREHDYDIRTKAAA
jgi:hypothetical protein